MLVRIFPHTRDEFEDEIDLKFWLKYTLAEDFKGRYRLRSLRGGLGENPVGTVVLFRLGHSIVGSAVVSQGPVPNQETIDGITYEGVIVFDTDTIRVYDCSIPIDFLEDLTQRSFNVAQPHYKIQIIEN